jgi:hypothetical protein
MLPARLISWLFELIQSLPERWREEQKKKFWLFERKQKRVVFDQHYHVPLRKVGKMNESEITRALDANTRAIITFEELVKHLATKEETALLRVDMAKLQVGLIKWIVGTNLAVGAGVIAAMAFLLQHWKP